MQSHLNFCSKPLNTMDPDKPVTNELIARGFGRDIYGLLLAWREREIVQRFNSLNISSRKITIVQAQKIIDIATSELCILACAQCDAVEHARDRPLSEWVIKMCEWCQNNFCPQCDDLSVERVCRKCKHHHNWCPNCGLDNCPRDEICECCGSASCADSMCTQCLIADDYAFTDENFPNRTNLESVMARLGLSFTRAM